MKNTFFSFVLPLLLLPSIRVAILKDIPKVTIEGKELWVKVEEVKPVSYHLPSPAHVLPTKEGFKIGYESFHHPFVQIGSQDDLLTVNGKNYKGMVEIRQNSNKKLIVLNELFLEDYLVGLVHGEIAASWPTEAIKAQVVAARTYAMLRQKQRQNHNAIYDLETDTMDQVYAPLQRSFQDQIISEAVKETEGEILWYLGLYPAYFHSTCGGQTEVADHVWGKKDSSVSIIDPYCENSPHGNWEIKISPKQFLHALKKHGLEGNRIQSIAIEQYENSPRNALTIVETNMTTLFLGATELRRILGYKELKSTWFDVTWSPREIVFTGKGYGHGVGLCQWGAKAMAEQGADYKTILQFYYPKAVVKKVY